MAFNRNAGFPMDVHQVDWDAGFPRQYGSGDTALTLHDHATHGKCIAVFRGLKSVFPGFGLFCHARNLGSTQVTLKALIAEAANGYDATDIVAQLRTRHTAGQTLSSGDLLLKSNTTIVLEVGEATDFIIDAQAHIGANEVLSLDDYLLLFANEATVDPFKGTSGELTLASYYGQLIPVSKYDASTAAIAPTSVTWAP